MPLTSCIFIFYIVPWLDEKRKKEERVLPDTTYFHVLGSRYSLDFSRIGLSGFEKFVRATWRLPSHSL